MGSQVEINAVDSTFVNSTLWQMTEGPWYVVIYNEPAGLPWWLNGKEPACQCRRCRFNHWVRKIPWRRTSWRRKWQPTPVFSHGKFHGHKSLVGYSPYGWVRVGHDLVPPPPQQVRLVDLQTQHAQLIEFVAIYFIPWNNICEGIENIWG